MLKELKIPYFNENESFDGAAVAEINEFPWGEEYQPLSRAKIYHTEDAFYIRLETEEKAENLRIVEAGITEDACEDSCMELFIMPYPEKDKRYFNFEFTLAGAIYLGIGHDRYDNVLLKDTDISQFNICTYMTNEKGIAKWKVEAKIPYKFLRETMGIDIPFSNGQEMRVNFYKCASSSRQVHHGVWNVIESDKADFHLPDYFGKAYIDYSVKKKQEFETKVNLTKYEDKIKAFEEHPENTGKIICYGSSTFTRWRDGKWGNQNLEEVLLDKNGNKVMLNHGFGGCTAEELLYYYPRAVKAFKPKGLIICIGWNDRAFGYSNNEVLAYISKIFDYARADFPGIKLALCDARPLYKGVGNKQSYFDTVYEFNEMCRSYCEAHEDCTLISHSNSPMFFEEGFTGDYSKVRADIYIEDKVHLTPDGYKEYAEFFKNELKNFF